MEETTVTEKPKRKDMTYRSPHALTIIGLDSAEDPEHPCYDPERIRLPIDPIKVANVREFGVTLPVVLRKNGMGPASDEVVDGKQRTRWAREAGISGIPTIYVRGTDDEIRRMVRDLNSIREDDPPSVRVAQAQRMLDRGLDRDFVAARFGIKEPMLRRLLKVQDTVPEVQAAVDAGELTITDATTKIAKLPRAKQARPRRP